MGDINASRGGCLGSTSVAFWTVVAGIAAVVTLVLAIPGVGGGAGTGSGTGTGTGTGSGTGNGSGTGTATSGGTESGTSSRGGTGTGDGNGENPALAELYGQWQGSGNQYANDSYTMQIDMTLAPDGGYLIIRDGATRDQGIYAVEGPLIHFQSSIGSQYVWHWTFAKYGARRMLKIQNEGGGIFMLQKA